MSERKSSQISTTVSAEVFEALEDHRWNVRKKMTEVVAEAVSDYIAKNNIKVGPEAGQPIEKTEEAAEKAKAPAKA